MSYNLETKKKKNKLYLEGNIPLVNNIYINNLLCKYDIIYFSITFNQKIDNLSSNIKAIHFSNYNISYSNNIFYYINSRNTNYDNAYDFNQPINNLPYNLLLLELSGGFAQSLAYLPFSLKCLILNIYEFINGMLDYLPPLEVLILKLHNYTYNTLPYELQELYLIGHCSKICAFPVELKLLFINGYTNKLDIHFSLPPKLEIFIFLDDDLQFNNNIIIIKSKLRNKEFPITLKEMQLPIGWCKYNTELIDLSSYIGTKFIIKYKNINDNIIKHIFDKYY
jgi:hypothetical protein